MHSRARVAAAWKHAPMTTHDQSPAERLAAIKAQMARLTRGSPEHPPTPEQVRTALARMLYGPRGKGRETKPHTDNQQSTGT